MMPDATCLAHAARRDDDVKAGQPGDRLALVDGLRESQLRRGQEPIQVDLRIEACCVSAKHLSRADRQRRVEKDRRGRYLPPFHQVDKIDNQLLRSFNGKGRDKQRAVGGRGVAYFLCEVSAPERGRCRWAVTVAVSRL